MLSSQPVLLPLPALILPLPALKAATFMRMTLEQLSVLIALLLKFQLLLELPVLSEPELTPLLP
jgi:hypothetical protein